VTNLRTLITGLVMGESPRWHDGRLWLSDWGAHQILAVDLGGQSEVVATVPSLPFSIDWLPDGQLIVIAAGALARLTADGSLTTPVDLTNISNRPWNEIVVDGRGNTYVNNIGFDMMGGEEPSPGFVALIKPDGTARRVADGLMFPNGMAVTPDNSTLIVAESYANRLTAFDIASDGALSNRRAWAELDGGVPDGICVDAEGAVWYADVPNQRCVRVRQGGGVLDTIELDRGCFACMLGETGGQTLFIVAAEWRGAAGMAEVTHTGQVVMAEAPAPHTGWP
jgi:sugar lactone lactonase YvrE